MARIRKVEPLNKLTEWFVALYVRLSREDDDIKNESLSVTNQKARLQAEFEKMQIEENVELYDIYVDDGFTGTNSNREDFQRMLSDIEKGFVNCVIVKDLSRLSRNYIEAGQYLEIQFVKKNTRFISLEAPALDSFKRPHEMNSIIVPITNVFNEEYARQTSIKIRGTKANQRQRGDFIGSFAPYGYMKDPEDKHHLIIDFVIAPVVKDIYNWFVNGSMSLGGIAKKLNELGIPNPTAYKKLSGSKYQSSNTSQNDGLWSTSTVRRILKNETYLGTLVQGKETTPSYKLKNRIMLPEEQWVKIPLSHEAIIENNIFMLAQEILARDTRAQNTGELSLFAGFVRCADCGKAMKKNSSKGHGYYQCRTYKEKSKLSCGKHTIRIAELEKAVLTTIQHQIALVGSLASCVDEVANSQNIEFRKARFKNMLHERRQELEKSQSIITSLYFDWKKGDITREHYLRIQEEVNKKIALIEQAVKNIEEEQRQLEEGLQTTNNTMFDAFNEFKGITNLDRNLLIRLVDTIYIHENGEVAIKFKFQDQYKRLLEYVEEEKTIENNEAITLSLAK